MLDLEGAVDGATLGVIDFVICPGVAFDNQCRRLGHGKGYYDTFIERLEIATEDRWIESKRVSIEGENDSSVRDGSTTVNTTSNSSSSSSSIHTTPPPRRVVLVGLSLDEQIIEQVPTDAHDRVLDYVITPSTVYQRIATTTGDS